jgi:DNA-binding response OmpR family regulator
LKVLVIDSDQEIIRDISFCLQVRYPDVKVIAVGEGRKGKELVKAESPELVLINSSLPDISTLDLVSEIREFSDVALLIVTNEQNPLERAKELEIGADEYIMKPFNPIEFLAKVRALLRRIEGKGFQQNNVINIGNELTVDFARHEVFLSGKRLNLTPIEYNLLATLVKNEGRVLTHSFLLGKVWGLDDNSDYSYIKKYVYRLRSKLKYLGDTSKVILTERGVGYRFMRPPTQ